MLYILVLQDPFWEKVFPTALGALTGGLVTLGGLVMKEWLDRRRSIQSWFEQFYITDGIERLIVYVSVLDSVLSNLLMGTRDDLALNEIYPREAVERFRTMLPDSTIPTLLAKCRNACEEIRKMTTEVANRKEEGSESTLQRVHKLVLTLRDELRSLEHALLECKITRKRSQVFRIRERKQIKAITVRIEERLRSANAEFKKLESEGNPMRGRD